VVAEEDWMIAVTAVFYALALYLMRRRLIK
jgi:hypothetical protein